MMSRECQRIKCSLWQDVPLRECSLSSSVNSNRNLGFFSSTSIPGLPVSSASLPRTWYNLPPIAILGSRLSFLDLWHRDLLWLVIWQSYSSGRAHPSISNNSECSVPVSSASHQWPPILTLGSRLSSLDFTARYLPWHSPSLHAHPSISHNSELPLFQGRNNRKNKEHDWSTKSASKQI